MKITRVIVSLLVALLPARTLSAADWPQFLGPDRNGVSTETNWNPLALQGGARVLWDLNIGYGYSSVSTQNGRLCALGLLKGQALVSCLDAATGEVIWQTAGEKAFMQYTTPAVDGDRVYALTYDGQFLCLQSADGRIVWSKRLKEDFKVTPPPKWFAASPVMDGELLLVNANTAGLALDKRTGKLRWSVEQPSIADDLGTYTTPLVRDFNGTRTVFFIGARSLIAVDEKTGKVLWSYACRGGTSIPEPVVFGNKVFVSDTNAVLLEAPGNKPNAVLSANAFDCWLYAPVLISGYLYGQHDMNNMPGDSIAGYLDAKGYFLLRAVQADTGSVAWENDSVFEAISAAGGKLLMLQQNGTLGIAEPSPQGITVLSSADVLAGAERPRTGALVTCHRIPEG